ncbi:MAG: VanW family protein [Clostridia bacterium]|nr:VanW family protein [Clostridia bacterium]
MKEYKLSKIGLITVIIFLLIAIIIAAAIALLSGDAIRDNISINGINVSGMSRKSAENMLNNMYNEKIENSFIALKFEGKEWNIKYSDLGYSYNVTEAVDKAYKVGHTGDFLVQLTETIQSKMKAQNFELESTYNDTPIDSLISKISKEIDQEVVDATIKYIGTGFQITEEKIGRKLNQENASSMIAEQLNKVDVAVLDLPVDIVAPIVKKSDLAVIQDKLGEFSTKFNAADVDRSTNIKVATNSTNNVLVRPGEVYSVNEILGPRLAKFGYKDAKVIINNELVPGIGGGVCQVSSTLYNAVLLSNLKIIERQNHSLTLSYVGLGRDATISGDYIDFKFMNNTDYPIYIYGEVKGSWVKFIVFGKSEHPGRTVKINTETIKTLNPTIKIIQDPTLPVGTEIIEKKSHVGYVVKTQRIVYQGDKEILRENLGTSNYRVVNGVTRIGTKVIPPPVVTPVIPPPVMPGGI